MEPVSQSIESIPRQRPWILIGSIFLLAVFIAISVRHAATSGQQVPSQIPMALSVWQTFFLFISAVLVVFLVTRFIHVSGFVAALFGAALFLGAWVYCWSIFPWDIALLIASGLTIIQARIRRVFVHDLFVLVGAAGIAIHFAFLFTDKSLAMIFASFLIYDMVAGRPNGPITHMASVLVHRGVIPGLIIPGKIRALFASVANTIRQPDAIFLGAGDLILPMTLVARAAVFGWWQAELVATGVLIGCVVLGFRKSLKPFPALIPLGIGAGIPYLIIFFIRL